ncbi:hypothetical protein Lal_00039164 [Lupinus albus]|nr:hypothetical protein Lal_00039164 [Lupinus albus]
MDEVLRVIESLQKTSKFKVATPANWKPGKKVVISPHVALFKTFRGTTQNVQADYQSRRPQDKTAQLSVIRFLTALSLPEKKGEKFAGNASAEIMRKKEKVKPFLWGGSDDHRKITRIKWEQLCKSKDDGGLGIKILNCNNLSLLSKWSWQLLIETKSLWARILRARYDSFDVAQLIVRRGSVGCGNNKVFWEEMWWSVQSSKDSFPSVYVISMDKYTQPMVIQNSVARWMDIQFINIVYTAENFRRLFKKNSSIETWSLWLPRNASSFRDEKFDVLDVLEGQV